MNELNLYKFITDNEIEIEWRSDHLYIWISPYHLSDFCEMVGDGYLSDGGLEATIINSGYVCVDIIDVCGHFGIDPERIEERRK